MVRFVVSPDGAVVPDLRNKLPGRGIWVSADRKTLENAVEKNVFARAAKQPAKADRALADQVAALLARQILNLLGLARRGGHIEQGFAKVDALLRAKKAKALIEACDGAEDGRRKMQRLAAAQEGLVTIGCFSSEELSLALGLENVVHAALKDGGVSSRILEECNRLKGFRLLQPGEWNNSPMALRGTAG